MNSCSVKVKLLVYLAVLILVKKLVDLNAFYIAVAYNFYIK